MDNNTISTCEIIWFTLVSPNHETRSNMDVVHHTMSYCDTNSPDLDCMHKLSSIIIKCHWTLKIYGRELTRFLLIGYPTLMSICEKRSRRIFLRKVFSKSAENSKLETTIKPFGLKM